MTRVLEDAFDWLRYAEEDLSAAHAMRSAPAVVPRRPAWLAQQAAEKAIKAVLVADNLPFPKTHDLERLATLLPDPSVLAQCNADLASLTEFAVGSRYPGDLPDTVLPGEATRAVDDAGRIVSAVRASLEARRS